MDITLEMHAAARVYYALVVDGGTPPRVAGGGSRDGLRYVPTKIGDTLVWLTEDGLVVPDARDKEG